jgi:NAD(P)-dependent dehydrogenase (short-subunit alcohol dehydrogenase family)
VLVTGGGGGIGLATAEALAARGASVTSLTRADADLADRPSVDALVDRLAAGGRPFDVVVCNAGIMACPLARTAEGWELQFATNHLGHFALVNRLWPAIAPGGARVVSVSSRGHHFSGIRWDDLHWARDYDKWQAYGQAKTANVLFAVHLDRLARDAGVRAFSLHPGGIMTPLQRHLSQAEMVERGWIDENGTLLTPELFKTPEQGAATQVWAATSPQLAGMGGVYLEDCDIAEPATADDDRSGVKDWAVDPEQAARLWEVSAELTGVNAFAA